MATGSGYPTPKTGGLLQAPAVIEAEKGAGASWLRIGKSLEGFASAVGDIAKKEVAEARIADKAKAEIADDRAYAELSLKHERDPDGFDRAWSEYKAGTLASVDPAQARERETYLNKLGGRGFAVTLAQKHDADGKQHRQALTTNTDNAEQELIGFAMAGQAGSAQAEDARNRLQGLLDTRVALGHLTQEEADQRIGRATSREAVETTKRFAKAEYERTGDLERAEDVLRKSILENTALAGSPEEKLQLYNQGRAELRVADAARRQDKAVLVQASKELRERIATPGLQIDDGEVDGTLNALKASGAHGEYGALSKAWSNRRALGALSATTTLADQGRLVEAGRLLAAMPPPVAAAIMAAAEKHGVNPALLGRMAQIESRFDPNVVNKDSKATGLFQFIPKTWWQYGGGADARDPVANADAAARLLLDNRKALAAGLGRAPTDGELYLAHQQGAQGALDLLKNPDRPAVELVGLRAVTLNGGTPGMTAGQFARLWTRKIGDGGLPSAEAVAEVAGGIRAATREHVKNARDLWSNVYKPAMTGEVPRIPDLDGLSTIVEAAAMSGDAKFQREVGVAAKAFDLAKELERHPAEKVQPFLEQLQAAAGGAGGEEVQQGITFLTKQFEKTRKAVAEDPIGWWAGVSGARPPDALDLSSPEALRAGLDYRLTLAGQVQQAKGLAPQSALRPVDVDQIASALRGGDGRQAGLILGALGRIPAENLEPTLATKELRQSIVGLTRSGDPAKMSVAYGFLGKEQTRNPLGFRDSYGAEVERDLAFWNRRGQFMGADDLVAWTKRRNDPEAKANREAAYAEADKALKDITPERVAAEFDRVAIVPFTDPALPVGVRPGEVTGGFMKDFAVEFRESYADLGDAKAASEEAVKALRSSWGVTAINAGVGGRLMKHPPEMRYEAVDGSHAWIEKQLDGFVRLKSGFEPGEKGGDKLEGLGGILPTDVRDFPAAAASGGVAKEQTKPARIYHAPRALVADVKTAEDVSNGRPASYQVVVQDPSGRYQLLMDASGPARFTPDRAAALEEARIAAAGRRAALLRGAGSVEFYQRMDRERSARERYTMQPQDE